MASSVHSLGKMVVGCCIVSAKLFNNLPTKYSLQVSMKSNDKIIANKWTILKHFIIILLFIIIYKNYNIIIVLIIEKKI